MLSNWQKHFTQLQESHLAARTAINQKEAAIRDKEAELSALRLQLRDCQAERDKAQQALVAGEHVLRVCCVSPNLHGGTLGGTPGSKPPSK